jgi:hypothetical protein
MGNIMLENPADLTIIVQGDNVNKHILPFLVDTDPERRILGQKLLVNFIRNPGQLVKMFFGFPEMLFFLVPSQVIGGDGGFIREHTFSLIDFGYVIHVAVQ